MWNRLFGTKRAASENVEKVSVEDALSQIEQQTAESLSNIIKNEEFGWRFVLAELSRQQSFGESSQKLLTVFLLPYEQIEISWAVDDSRKDVGAVRYLSDQVQPTISEMFGEELSQLLITKCFLNYCLSHTNFLLAGRFKTALSRYEHCMAAGEVSEGKRWGAIIREMGGVEPGVSIGKRWFSRAPENQQELEGLTELVASDLALSLPTEQDVYWFVVEEYDRILERGQMLPVLYRLFSLHPIEHQGRRSEESYVGHANAGVVFLDDFVSPSLKKIYGAETADQIRAGIYTRFRAVMKGDIDILRTKYAEHYRNNCIKMGADNNASLWDDVIESLASMR